MSSRTLLCALGLFVSLSLSACGGVAVESEPAAAPPPAATEPATRFGTVRFQSLPWNLFADAWFEDRAPEAPTSGCRIVPTREPGKGLSAGAVSMAFASGQPRGKGRETTLQLGWDPVKGGYEFADSATDYESKRLDLPGTSVTFTTSGDAVPAFAVAIGTADEITLKGSRTTGEGGVVATLDARAAKDLTLAWSASTNEATEFYLGAATESLVCRFPSPATTGTVPADLLARVLAAPEFRGECPAGTTCIAGGFRGLRETKVRAGAYEVTAEAMYTLPVDLYVAP